MDQAVSGSTLQQAIDQPAGIPASPFMITSLAERYVQVLDAPCSGENSYQVNDEQEALDTLMAYLDPMSLDEVLTLGESVFQDLDGMVYDADVREDNDVDCSTAKMRRLAKTMKAICCGLKRHGARDLRMSEHVD